MKKVALLLALASTLSFTGLTSCNEGGSNTSDSVDRHYDIPDTFDPNISAEITFAVQDGTGYYYTNLINAFNTAFPNIKVNVEENGNYAAIDSQIRYGLSSGQVVYNMALTYPDYVAAYLGKNGTSSSSRFVLKLDDYMNDDVYGFGKNDPTITYNGQQVQLHSDFDDLIPNYVDDGASFGVEGQFELPLSKSTEMLFVNKDMLTEAATTLGTTYEALKAKLGTWEGVWEVVDQLKQAKPDLFNGKPAEENGSAAPLVYEDEANFYITLCQQLGIPYVDSTKSVPVLFGSDGLQGTADLMKFLGEKYNTGCFVSEGTSGTTNYYATSTFANGQSAMIITTTAGLSWLNNYTGPFFNIDVLPMPTSQTDWVHGGAALPASADSDAVISQGPGVVMFDSGDDTQNLATWLFYKTITSDFLNAQWVSAGSYAPIRSSVYDTETFDHMFDVPAEDEAEIDPDGKNAPASYEFYPIMAEAKKQMYDVINSYDAASRTYTTDVFPGSSSARTQAGYILSGCVLSENNTDTEALKKIINQYYVQAVQSLPLE